MSKSPELNTCASWSHQIDSTAQYTTLKPVKHKANPFLLKNPTKACKNGKVLNVQSPCTFPFMYFPFFRKREKVIVFWLCRSETGISLALWWSWWLAQLASSTSKSFLLSSSTQVTWHLLWLGRAALGSHSGAWRRGGNQHCLIWWGTVATDRSKPGRHYCPHHFAQPSLPSIWFLLGACS